MNGPFEETREEIILIGPMGVGKTALALHLSEQLGVLSFPIDRLKWYYRFKNGYDIAHGTRVLQTEGFPALLEYGSRYFGYAEIEEILHSFRGGIFDFGASHTHFENQRSVERAKRLFASFQNIFLILPTTDFVRNCEILDERLKRRYEDVEWKRGVLESYLRQNRVFLSSSSYSALARDTVYTDGKSVQQVGQEIIEKAYQFQASIV